MSVIEGQVFVPYETPMYFRYIYYLMIVMLWRISMGEHSMLIKFGKEICSNKRVHQIRFSIYFGLVQTFGSLLLDSMLFLGPVLVI